MSKHLGSKQAAGINKTQEKARWEKSMSAMELSRNNSGLKHKITCGTREWADHNINCCLGCYNDCRYCYAKKMATRFGRATPENWKDMRVRTEQMNRAHRKMKGRVMFPTSHDIIDMPEIEEACFRTLGKLIKAGNEILVTTKPRLAVIRKIDERFSQNKEKIQFRFTITSCNDELLKFWEPNAPLFEERMKSLIYAFERGYKTSVSIEPFLDHNPEPLVKTVTPYSTESIWVGKMNYIPRNGIGEFETPFYEDIRRNYELSHLMEVHAKLKNHPKIRFKDSILNKLSLFWES